MVWCLKLHSYNVEGLQGTHQALVAKLFAGAITAMFVDSTIDLTTYSTPIAVPAYKACKMGRTDLRALRVHDAAALLMKTNPKRARQPPWFQSMTDNPPAQALVRTQPVQHRDLNPKQRLKKPSRMFQPQRIEYLEDELRHTFFADHPWELARPRIILENHGNDHKRWDWSKAQQPGRPVSGER